jgi:hypothetical protein
VGLPTSFFSLTGLFPDLKEQATLLGCRGWKIRSFLVHVTDFTSTWPYMQFHHPDD